MELVYTLYTSTIIENYTNLAAFYLGYNNSLHPLFYPLYNIHNFRDSLQTVGVKTANT